MRKQALPPAVVDEYLRTFAGRTGVLASLGTYRGAFTSITQTEPPVECPLTAPVVAIGGEKGSARGSARWSPRSPNA